MTTINATMGLKLPKNLWKAIDTACAERDTTPSGLIRHITQEFQRNPLLLVEAMQYALSLEEPPEADDPKNTSCSIDVVSFQCLQNTCEKLEMPREALLRLLTRYFLAKGLGLNRA